ncbi:hypothetical protein GCM10027280_41480 [Micromonospora polyrhachis]|uniref:Uncharacterized protein n=1 Tax=Micromonospora polyrhachis TaxID=1282883 RepID=A0A7W7WMT7_9ACTN|nr:hypothetical protein [Micromonospora polyrhachis]MBB4957155.1 hypothetical protein [Micromonospora polyrhachis]
MPGERPAPRPPLGLTETENLIRASELSRLVAGGPAHPTHLRVDLLRLGGQVGEGRLRVDAGHREWPAHDSAGRPRLRLSGMCFSG